MSLRAQLCLLALLLGAGPALADAVSPAPDGVEVTIYRGELTPYGPVKNGLGMITETRTIEVAAGETRISFQGVADAMAPQTARIEGLPEAVLDQDFDYDLLSHGSLIAQSVGARVKVSRTNPVTGEVTERPATLVSSAEGAIVSIDGGVEALRCSGLPEKLVFEGVPLGLSDRPTLSVRTPPLPQGRYTIRLSYLARGMDWSANYVAHIRPDRRTLDLLGWVTLVNRGSVTFADAPTQVVAGRWNRVGQGPAGPRIEPVQATLTCRFGTDPEAVEEIVVTGSRVPEAGLTSMAPSPAPPPPPPPPPMAEQSELGDYKLYSLPGRTTVAANQSKQVALLDLKGVPFERIYRYELNLAFLPAEPMAFPATVLLTLQNKASSRLGKPLPSGAVSVMEDGPRGEVFAGQDRIEDIPVGSPFEVELGRAPDLVVAPRVVSRETDEAGMVRTRIEVSIRNGKPVPVAFQLRHAITAANFKVLEQSRRHALEAGRPQWSIRLKPGESQTLSYTFVQVG